MTPVTLLDLPKNGIRVRFFIRRQSCEPTSYVFACEYGGQMKIIVSHDPDYLPFRRCGDVLEFA